MTAVCYGLYFLLSQIDNNQDWTTHREKVLRCVFANTGLLKRLTDISTEYSVIAPIISDAIIKPISEVIGQPVMMYHRHDDLIEEKEALTEPQACNCSIVQLLLRYSRQLATSVATEKMVEDFFVSQFASVAFKQYLSVELLRYYRFMERVKPIDDERMMKIESIKYQINSTMLLTMHLFDHFDFSHLFQILFDAARNTTARCDLLSHGLATLIDTLKNNTAVRHRFFSHPTYVSSYLEVLKLTQKNRFEFTAAVIFGGLTDDFYTEIEPAFRINMFMDSVQVLRLSQLISSDLNRSPPEQTREHLLVMMKALKPLIAALPIGENFTNSSNFHCVNLERAMALCMAFYLLCDVEVGEQRELLVRDITLESLAALNRELFASETEKEVKNFYKIMLANFSRAFGFMREVTRGLWVNLV